MPQALRLKSFGSQVTGDGQRGRTFTHVGATSDRAFMLHPSWVNTSPKFEETGLIPLCGIGYDLGKYVR